MRKTSISFAAGILTGAVMFGGTAAIAAGIAATPSKQSIYVDGQPVAMTAYSILGNNYVKLRDVGQTVDFGVSYDAATNTVQISTKTGYAPEVKPSTDAQYIPKAGDVIHCTDGTDYHITDVSRYDRNMFADGPLGPLPTATCDWSQFPDVELPVAEAKHQVVEGDSYLFLRNLYETRRMQYTLYNAIGSNPQTWKDGRLVLRSDGSPLARVQLHITDYETAQSFWPWREDQITDGFHSCPAGLYQLEAWDVFKNGVFLYTEYMVSVK